MARQTTLRNNALHKALTKVERRHRELTKRARFESLVEVSGHVAVHKRAPRKYAPLNSERRESTLGFHSVQETLMATLAYADARKAA